MKYCSMVSFWFKNQRCKGQGKNPLVKFFQSQVPWDSEHPELCMPFHIPRCTLPFPPSSAFHSTSSPPPQHQLPLSVYSQST